MTAREIRTTPIQSEYVSSAPEMTVARSLDECAQWLREIAAQLADRNAAEGRSHIWQSQPGGNK